MAMIKIIGTHQCAHDKNSIGFHFHSTHIRVVDLFWLATDSLFVTALLFIAYNYCSRSARVLVVAKKDEETKLKKTIIRFFPP